MEKTFDVVGVGLNATDTLLLVPQFPAYGGKAPFVREILSPGGQVASAMVACVKLGLRTKYIGSVGDDKGGRILMRSLEGSGIDITHVQLRRDCPNQSAYIVIDQTTGERTILWQRPDCLRIVPEHIAPEQILCARLLHIDGHDTAAVEHAAKIAHGNGIPVTVDVDTIYHGFDKVLPYVDYLIASTNFPVEWTSQRDPFLALELIQREYGMKVAAMTLGPYGAMALVDGQFPLLAGLRGELPGHDRRGRRVPRRLLLRRGGGLLDRRRAGTLERHGGAELQGAGGAGRHSRLGSGASAHRDRRTPVQPGLCQPLRLLLRSRAGR